jgi:hypothetical protein
MWSAAPTPGRVSAIEHRLALYDDRTSMIAMEKQ